MSNLSLVLVIFIFVPVKNFLSETNNYKICTLFSSRQKNIYVNRKVTQIKQVHKIITIAASVSI